MEQLWSNTIPPLTVQDIPQDAIEASCSHSLALIQRNCEYLNQHFEHAKPDPETRQAVDDIVASAAKLERSFSEVLTLLDFLRTDQSRQLQTVDLCALLRQIAAQADMIHAQLGVELTLDYGGQTECLVQADLDDAEQLVLHLLSNALRACAQGGQVFLSIRRSEDSWQLTVQDNGCGLPDSSPQNLLDNRRAFLGGAQLGLLICRECCRRMGWQLVIQPAPDRGTQAIITIPLSDPSVCSTDAVLSSGANSKDQSYRLRATLVKELHTMPELGDLEEFP